MTTSLEGVQGCVFDAYGTLFDFGSAAARCKDVLGDQAAPLTTLWRDKQLQYTWLRGLQGKHADFWQVTGDALDFALETLRIGDTGLRRRLLDLYLTLEPFPEVGATLRMLRDAGLATAILSNGTPQMLAAAIGYARLDGLFDAVISVEEVVSTSPTPMCTSERSIGSGSSPGGSAFNRRTGGTPMPLRPSGCASSGAIGTDNSRSDCRGDPTP